MEWKKSTVMDENQIKRTLVRIAHEILEKDPDEKHFLLLGIRRRGEVLAKAIQKNLEEFSKAKVSYAAIDISLYRDDISERYESPKVQDGHLQSSDVKDATVVLVDDVIFTGRTLRAAMDYVIEIGRPRAIRAAVLVDRGHRELPIRPDFVGKNIPTSKKERVRVSVEAWDGENSVSIWEAE